MPDLLELYQSPSIFTRFGIKQFTYKVVPDLEIDGDEASTLITNSHVRIRVSETTFRRAEALDRRARFTFAHEFGHGVLHRNKEELARGRQHQFRLGSPVVSVERQADRFADGFLVTDVMVQIATSADHLAQIALISDRASDIIWEREQNRLKRPIVADGLRRLSAELKNQNRDTQESLSYLCPSCGKHTLLKLDTKYHCVGECERYPVREACLFGSRARGEARVDSDWDLVAVVADAAPDSQTDPITAFEIGRMAEVPVTLLVTRQSDLAAIWGLPNTIGYDLAREGIRLRVG